MPHRFPRLVSASAFSLSLLALAAGCGPKAPAAGGAPAANAAGASGAPATGPKHAAGENPFVGAKWWDDPYSQAHLRHLRAKSKGDTETAALLEPLAKNGGADWIGEWTPYVERWVDKRITMLQKGGAFPYFVAYKIPKRDCGNYSAGGAAKGSEYKEWITQFARGIGGRKSAVILEPDAVPLLTKCLSPEDQKERIELLKFAVHTFASLGQTWVYIDAGHSDWVPAPELAQRLKMVGIEEADGFALNTSNYKSTEEIIKFGKELSALTGGKHFVIDTSRNGNGAPKAQKDSEESWCNPPGRAIGAAPTSETGDPLVDAFLWIKKPGESDGTCNGGPKAGEWWQEKALELSRNGKK